MPRMADELPELRIIAGPNGSGKTTFVREFLPRYLTVPHPRRARRRSDYPGRRSLPALRESRRRAMKPNGSAAPQGPLREEALRALRDAVGTVIAEHKRFGIPLVIWRDGKIVEISPEEAETEYLAEKARAELDEAARKE
jgi:hypothetical protein